MPWNAIARAIGIDADGGSVRDALSALWARLTRDRAAGRTPGYRTVAFTIAVTTLAAKMAKADGVALPVEERAFERVFNIPPDEKANFRRLFDLAAQDIAGYEIYAGKIAALLADEPEMLRALLECLFHVAAADGVLHPDEDQFLSVVAEKFGLTRGEFLSVRAGFVNDPCSPYQILGVHPDISDAELKLRHRALVREHHPDRLAATGVPPELRCAANRRLASINVAYDEIVEDRRRAAEMRGDAAMILKPDSPLVHALHPSRNTGDRRKGCRADMIVLHYTGMSSADKAIALAGQPEEQGLLPLRDRRSGRHHADGGGDAARLARRRLALGRRDRHQLGVDRHRDPKPRTRARLSGFSGRADAGRCRAVPRYRQAPRHPCRARAGAFGCGAGAQDRPGRKVRLGAPGKARRRALG